MTKEQFLAFSLPYGLKCKRSDGYGVDELKSIDFGQKTCIFDNCYNLPIRCLFPILHPLTDITKPITHKGETFVPIDELNRLFGYAEVRLVNYINSGVGWGIDASYTDTAVSFNDMINPILKLIEWHFDIDGLIEKGEAVDVNTLEANPYE